MEMARADRAMADCQVHRMTAGAMARGHPRRHQGGAAAFLTDVPAAGRGLETQGCGSVVIESRRIRAVQVETRPVSLD
ncbi:hypothetical protein THIX_90669 [Thiomonas sp. X19]|nr:hypothetical protein THIX_90669 [Thiomonas sp. X19]